MEAGRQRLFDTVASFVAGAATPEGQLMRRLLGESSGWRGLPTRAGGQDARPTSTADLIRYMCAATRSTEVDDIYIPSCTTIGSIVVPVALLEAAKQQSDERDVLCSVVVGYEAMARFGLAVDGAITLYKGVWPTYLAAPFTAAATVARLLAFPREQTAHALAIAAARSSGVNARTTGHNSSRWFDAGCAAADGYLATQAAALGMIGDPNVFEQGLPRAVAAEFDMSAFSGDRWLIQDVDTKPFCTSRQGLSATEAFVRAIDSRSGAEIDAVRAWVPGQVLAMVDSPNPPLGLPYQLALAARDRPSLWDVARARPPVRPLEHVQVLEDERLSALYPTQWGGRVEVSWQDGSTASQEVLDPPGSARNPFGWAELMDKHRRIAAAGSLPDGWIKPVCQLCRDFGREAGSRAGELLGRLPGLEDAT